MKDLYIFTFCYLDSIYVYFCLFMKLVVDNNKYNKILQPVFWEDCYHQSAFPLDTINTLRTTRSSHLISASSSDAPSHLQLLVDRRSQLQTAVRLCQCRDAAFSYDAVLHTISRFFRVSAAPLAVMTPAIVKRRQAMEGSSGANGLFLSLPCSSQFRVIKEGKVLLIFSL